MNTPNLSEIFTKDSRVTVHVSPATFAELRSKLIEANEWHAQPESRSIILNYGNLVIVEDKPFLPVQHRSEIHTACWDAPGLTPYDRARRRLVSNVMVSIDRRIQEEKWTDAQAMAAMGIDQRTYRAFCKGPALFSFSTLLEILCALDMRVVPTVIRNT